jgi:hypothetical protein
MDISPIFLERGFAVDQLTYLDFIKRGLVPFIKEHHSDGNYIFWPDQAGAHYSNIVVDYFEGKNIKFVKKFENPANVQEVRAIEDFWSFLKGKVYEIIGMQET